ncbi:MAG TPA: adenosylcobinamide-GDP ribazoletransferase [Actinomycetales bacterium]|nr:adenosylcobinamide-GDP ribazoletransferase [Actinomycetales bacterium]
MTADPLRLALGTLTAVPVRPPSRLDRSTAGRAMSLAPLACVPLAVLVGAVCGLGALSPVPPLVVGAAAVGALGLGSRGLHLDGLADTADGLASSYDRDRALAVMRTGDVGPVGAATLVLVLLAQAASLQALVSSGGWAAAVGPAIAVVLSRSVLVLVCARGVPAARPSGLGATVAGSVGRLRVALVLAGTGLAASLALAAVGEWWWAGPAALAAALLVCALLLARCVRRLGGVTGDVMGACVEAALTAALVVLAATVA